jgi:hypothetical protein
MLGLGLNFGSSESGSSAARMGGGAAGAFDQFRLYATDSSGNFTADTIAIDNFRIYTAADLGGDIHPGEATEAGGWQQLNLDSAGGGGTYTVTHGYQHPAYPAWRAFNGNDSQGIGYAWWTLSGSTAADSWVNLEINGGAIVPLSFRVSWISGFSSAAGFKIYGNNGGAADDHSTLLASYTNIAGGGPVTINYSG